MSYKPPHGTLDFLFAGPKTTKRYVRDNDAYRRCWYGEKARKDNRRR